MLFAVFDTETTGLPFHERASLKLQPRIIEFAGLITDGEEILDTLEFICNPGIAIEAIITEITGLKNEGLADKPDFIKFVPQLKEFFNKARGRIAHNLAFDRHMLQFDAARRDLTLDDLGYFDGDLPGHQYPLQAIEICTVEQTFHKYGKRMRLQDLYQLHFGPYVQKHRALDDVKLLHKIAQAEGVYEAFRAHPENH